MGQEKEIAWITGATAGIGRACALELADAGYDLVLTGRRRDRLEELASILSLKTDVVILPFDLMDRVALQSAWESLGEGWKKADVLINNAGLALGFDPIHLGNTDHWDQMIDTNLKGLLYLSRLLTPGMVERRQGHVVNIGSIAGKEAYPNGNVYCATKFAVDGLTRGMRIDLLPYGIRVTAIHPGMVETEFSTVRFEGDEARARGVYAGLHPLEAGDIARAVLFALQSPPHVNISDMVITPVAQASPPYVVRNSIT